MEDARRELASSVAAWLWSEQKRPPIVYLLNGSGHPIYDVAVVLNCDQEIITTHYPVRGPTSEAVEATRVTAKAIAALARHGLGDGSHWFKLASQGQLAVSLSFMDANGRWWSRSATGGLKEFSDRRSAEQSITAKPCHSSSPKI